MIKSREFKKRRKQILRMIGDSAIAIIRARPEYLRNGDAHYRYRQDSDFYYLSGFREPEALLVLCPGSDCGDEVMFCREYDRKKVIWDGPMLGTAGVVERLAFDSAYSINEIDQRLPELMLDREKVYFMMGEDTVFDQQVSRWTKSVKHRKGEKSRAPEEFGSLQHLLHDMRLYKSPAEIKCMKKAADIAAEAHTAMMRRCRPGLGEYDLHAEFMQRVIARQSEPSYLPIVGSGPNACILHHINNDRVMQDGDLVLVDAGAEYDHYASDITRTYPVNGRFSGPQRDLYEVVLGAQQAAIEQVRPGKHWNDPHDAAARAIAQGLLDLKILKGDIDQVMEEKTYAQYYMHMTGHWLGLDVHDCGDYKVDKLWVELEPGMVMTVEPGIYIDPEAKVKAHWKGLGIRIEDDVAVTANGHSILSDRAVKSVHEIETLMRAD